MRVEINFRPYPEQKPPEEGAFHVLLGGFHFHERREQYFPFRDEEIRWTNQHVTHFALDSDITVIEAEDSAHEAAMTKEPK